MSISLWSKRFAITAAQTYFTVLVLRRPTTVGEVSAVQGEERSGYLFSLLNWSIRETSARMTLLLLLMLTRALVEGLQCRYIVPQRLEWSLNTCGSLTAGRRKDRRGNVQWREEGDHNADVVMMMMIVCSSEDTGECW